MAQKLTTGLLRTILSSQCRKLQSLSSVSFQMPAFAARSVMRSLPLTSVQRSHYSTDVALRDFLKEEIEAEKEVAKKQLDAKKQSHSITGFQIKTDEADVTLTKTHNDEKITVYFNVNDCVRPHDDAESGTVDKEEQKERDESVAPEYPMYAEPSFRVEIEKSGQKLMFECDFVPEYGDESGEPSEEDSDELFNIMAVYMTTGEITDKVYGASGEILDGTLYDHLFDYLADRGIDNKFGEELIHFATHYEHAQYVNLLQKLKEFVSK